MSKRLERKVTKHEKNIHTGPCTIILREVQIYHELKEQMRAGEKKNKEVQIPDLKKLKGELRKEIKQEFQKKTDLLTAVSKSDLSD